MHREEKLFFTRIIFKGLSMESEKPIAATVEMDGKVLIGQGSDFYLTFRHRAGDQKGKGKPGR